MNSSTFLRRSLMMLAGIALATGITVFFLNSWFNASLLPALGTPQPLGNAIGSMLVVFASYVGVRMVSLAFFRDHAFGQEIRVDELADQRDRKEVVIAGALLGFGEDAEQHGAQPTTRRRHPFRPARACGMAPLAGQNR